MTQQNIRSRSGRHISALHMMMIEPSRPRWRVEAGCAHGTLTAFHLSALSSLREARFKALIKKSPGTALAEVDTNDLYIRSRQARLVISQCIVHQGRDKLGDKQG
eukprot:g48901.t1